MAQPKVIAIPVDWSGAADQVPVRYANQAMVQISERDVLVSFFMMTPPLVIGTADEVHAQLSAVDKIKPECLARISMHPETMRSLLELIQAKLIEIEEAARSNGS